MASIKQGLEQKLQQRLSPLQIQTIKVIEMPVQALEQYVRDRLANRDDIALERIFITDSGGYTDEQRLAVEKVVRECQPFREVLHTRAGCTVSSHCGPGTMGILYFHK